MHIRIKILLGWYIKQFSNDRDIIYICNCSAGIQCTGILFVQITPPPIFKIGSYLHFNCSNMHYRDNHQTLIFLYIYWQIDYWYCSHKRKPTLLSHWQLFLVLFFGHLNQGFNRITIFRHRSWVLIWSQYSHLEFETRHNVLCSYLHVSFFK